MKKLSIIVAMLLAVSLLAGCAGTPVVYYTDCTCPVNAHEEVQVAVPAETVPETEAEAPAEGALKTGLALVTGISESKSAAAEENGEAKYDVTIVAVTLDENNVIRNCIIDGIAASVKFDAAGALTTELGAVQTKNELGENYGMVAYGGAIAEWDAQAAALASFAVGKTVEELRSGAIDETGKAPAGSDLASSATIYLGGYVSAIEAAAANAQNLGAQAGDELKLATVSDFESSKAAAADAEGLAQLYTTVAALTMQGDTITSCTIDAVQAKVNFDAAGAVTSDVTAAIQTKNELGENYGMKKASSIGAEWDAQAASFASYITGKTVADVAGIAVDEKTATTDADLAASVTIKIGGFQKLIAKAAGAEAGAPKTGLAIAANAKDSKSATAEEAGEAKYDVTMVAVLVDDNGVIRDCIIDGIATSVQFDNKGALVTDIAAAPQTKNELGENYGMVAWGGAIAEWDAQAAALASFAVGKTVEELKSGAIDETGKAPAGSDLATQADRKSVV